MTGSVVDHDKFFKKYGVPYDPIKHGTPPDFGGATIHVPGKGDVPITMSNNIKHIREHATQFNTPEDYVKAYDGVISHPKFKAFVSGGNTGGAVTLQFSAPQPRSWRCSAKTVKR
ncbi:hypothetical protein [Celeribacter ethanolicus]|uniref:hypothetical protein n=1 Tax=Celeribacter ethanolicus TaxID=1758178 RepID=UPI0012FD218B|nr:hypothetical protein [Celeribacter ethanolicus]